MIFNRSAPEHEGLTLKLRDHQYTFNTPAEFEFALAGRTSVPSAKITALANVGDKDLLKQASDIKMAEQLLADSLSSVLEDSSRINDVLKEIDLTLISNDNDWRTIISVLMAVPASYESYKKIALVKYMQYLVSRQEIVRGLHLHRQVYRDMEVKHFDAEEDEAGLKETAILEHSTFRTTSSERAEYKRLPKGETVELLLGAKEIFTFFVARHQCAIVMRDRPYFIDADGRETSLRSGKNIVGRDLAADIIMEARMRDISRKHLVIESEGADVVRLTDISSHGTWVHPRYVEGAGI